MKKWIIASCGQDIELSTEYKKGKLKVWKGDVLIEESSVDHISNILPALRINNEKLNIVVYIISTGFGYDTKLLNLNEKFDIQDIKIKKTNDQKLSFIIMPVALIVFIFIIVTQIKSEKYSAALFLTACFSLILWAVVVNVFTKIKFSKIGLTVNTLFSKRQFLWKDLEWYDDKLDTKNIIYLLKLKFKGTGELILIREQIFSDLNSYNYFDGILKELKKDNSLTLSVDKQKLKAFSTDQRARWFMLGFIIFAFLYFAVNSYNKITNVSQLQALLTPVEYVAKETSDINTRNISYTFNNQNFNQEVSVSVCGINGEVMLVNKTNPNQLCFESQITKKKNLAYNSIRAVVIVFISGVIFYWLIRYMAQKEKAELPQP